MAGRRRGARLRAIRDAGVGALAEADRLVAMLRPGTTAAPRLAPLLDRARATGARVLITPPEPRLPPDVEAIAYRVVQEALTNAMKHAPGAALDIHTGKTSAIADTGSGLGLAGMRERLATLGGTLDAEPETDGGFQVCARLPIDRTNNDDGDPAALSAILSTDHT